MWVTGMVTYSKYLYSILFSIALTFNPVEVKKFRYYSDKLIKHFKQTAFGIVATY